MQARCSQNLESVLGDLLNGLICSDCADAQKFQVWAVPCIKASEIFASNKELPCILSLLLSTTCMHNCQGVVVPWVAI